MERKYELDFNDSINVKGDILYRIVALKSFSNVKKGEKGGYIKSEENLSHEGNCWVYDDARVHGSSIVKDNATVQNYAIVWSSILEDFSRVSGNARVFGSSIRGASFINDFVNITHSTIEDSQFWDCCAIEGSTIINSDISGSAIIENAATVENSEIDGFVTIRYVDLVYMELHGNAVIENDHDYIIFKNNFSSGRHFIWTKSNDMWSVGCFYGTGQELINKAYKDDERKGKCYEAYVNLVETLKPLL